MERNGLVASTLHHGTVPEQLERLFLASGNGVPQFGKFLYLIISYVNISYGESFVQLHL